MLILPSKTDELESNLKNKPDKTWLDIFETGLKRYENHLIGEVIARRYGLLETVEKSCIDLMLDRRTYYFYREIALNFYLCMAIQSGKMAITGREEIE